MQAVLNYAHDPMCSWCWGFSPVLARLEQGLPETVIMRRLLGGLAPDTDEPMPAEMRERTQATWRQVEDAVPGTVFNFDFWKYCEPRRSTYASCRAVIAARAQGERNDKVMNAAIQKAYYTRALNPSDTDTLIRIAGEIGLDVPQFSAALDSDATRAQLDSEIAACELLRIFSFPALVLVRDKSRWQIPVDYRSADSMLNAVNGLLARE